MKITWLGHACYLLESDNGTRIVIDPFNPEIGYKAPNVKADIVTRSHEHHDHNAIDQVLGSFQVIDSVEKRVVDGITVSGINTYHDQEKGSKRGENRVFKYEVDNLDIVHCGDLGHMLSIEQIEKLGNIDVLFIPVGSVYTIDGEKAYELVKKMNPKVVIPMHYKTSQLKIDLRPVDDFLKLVDTYQQEDTNYINISQDNIVNISPVVVLLEPK